MIYRSSLLVQGEFSMTDQTPIVADLLIYTVMFGRYLFNCVNHDRNLPTGRKLSCYV